MIPLLLSFARVGSIPAYFEPLLFCKYEKFEYHTTNDDQIDEMESMLTDGGKRGGWKDCDTVEENTQEDI
jgi:hypothetical protein